MQPKFNSWPRNGLTESGRLMEEKENLNMFTNRATLIGFLGKDAEVRYTRNETPFTVLSLATKRSWKNRETGEYESETTWHRCIVWGARGEFAATLTKGAHVQIEGEIRKKYAVAKTLREQLDDAVAEEDYERAARLRDQIKARAAR